MADAKSTSTRAKTMALLSAIQKRQLCLLACFSIFISIMETVGISSIMPFISVASNFSLIEKNEWINKIYNTFPFTSPQQFVLVVGSCLVFFYFFKNGVSLFYMYITSRFTQGIAQNIAVKLFDRYIRLCYIDFIKQDTTELTKKLVIERQQIASYYGAMMLLISELFIIAFIYLALMTVDYKITLALSLFIAFKALIFLKTISKKMAYEGEKIHFYLKGYYKSISEGLKNLKIIKLTSSENIIEENFNISGKHYMESSVITATISHIPRLAFESVGFSILICIIMYVIYSKGNPESVIPTISMFAIALYRLLPSVNRVMASYNTMRLNNVSLNLIFDDLNRPIEEYGNKQLSFKSEIKFSNLSFAYDDHPVLSDISLAIKKGERVALIGPSGAGKSTIADILIGMYSNFKGSIFIDGTKLTTDNLKSWRSLVGYIPQSMFLFDSTVGENVAFGRRYDENKVIEALEKANLKNFLDSKEGTKTPVGENGELLSGGQKQRIAIARALYGNPPILVLDEATSALDTATESKIMSHLYGLNSNTTIIIIAHRLSTIKSCDKVYLVENGTISPVTDLKKYEQQQQDCGKAEIFS
ncbi:ATP-binding cassette domain-containing protein [Maridesulfovibrio sp.]|uniref:ABC transporter ATP-binding protein n=1 Tax=Maridesulfovibrio sp. TaxID=2795000 RepID=UPI002A18D544|nr:ATP-binding cassette domain-containing protein [Maridesulfovibrio sp.]